MKGLLIKDIRLLMQRKNYFIGLLALAFVMSFTLSGSFVVGYLTLIIAFFSISSMSYDEYDNCYAFLMTLPIDRRIYVKEKYICGLILSLAGWSAGLILNIAGLLVQKETAMIGAGLVIDALIFIPISMLALDLMLPLQLKFGMEKSRMMVFLIGGAGMLIGFLGSKITDQMPDKAGAVLKVLNDLGETGIILGTFGIAILLTVLSYSISYGIFKKKEF